MSSSPIGNRPEYVIDAIYTQRFSYDGSSNIEYIGKAQPGTGTDDGFWQIQKLTYDGSNNLTRVEWAEGSDEFRFAWDDRASYSYA